MHRLCGVARPEARGARRIRRSPPAHCLRARCAPALVLLPCQHSLPREPPGTHLWPVAGGCGALRGPASRAAGTRSRAAAGVGGGPRRGGGVLLRCKHPRRSPAALPSAAAAAPASRHARRLSRLLSAQRWAPLPQRRAPSSEFLSRSAGARQGSAPLPSASASATQPESSILAPTQVDCARMQRVLACPQLGHSARFWRSQPTGRA